MPVVYRLACSHCARTRIIGALDVLSATLSDGTSQPLRHPGEDRHARQLTGLGLKDLSKVGRLQRRCTAICSRCHMITPLPADAGIPTCTQCDNSELLHVVELLHAKSAALPCLKCRTGHLVVEPAGRS